MESLKKNAKSIFIMGILFLTEISAIIRANVLYNDDLGRNLEGYMGNAYDSRYISDWISILVNCNKHVSDVSPLTQILACLFLALSVIIVFKILGKSEKIGILPYVCGTIILSPYFLENISYKVDSVFMALSILAVIIPFLWMDSKYKYIAASVIGLLVMCMTYQASSGVYPMLVILIAFWNWNYGKNTLKESLIFVAKSAITYILTLAFFAVFLVKPIEEGYINNGVSYIYDDYCRFHEVVESVGDFGSHCICDGFGIIFSGKKDICLYRCDRYRYTVVTHSVWSISAS